MTTAQNLSSQISSIYISRNIMLDLMRKQDYNVNDYDKFTNGAIAKYNEEKEVLDENDEGYVYNTGEIIQEGTSVCLKKGCGECDKILGLGWYHGINTPANGLPYLAYNKKNEKIVSHAFSGTHSNVINHTVVVTWDESEMEEGCPISHVDNYINGVKQE
jgi:hypothetical protein